MSTLVDSRTVDRQPPMSEEDIKEARRRERWNAFWTPFITLTAVVSSVAMLMVLIQTCQQRNLPSLILPPTSPLNRPDAVKPAERGEGGRNQPAGAPAPDSDR
jgi:hypothetical protein